MNVNLSNLSIQSMKSVVKKKKPTAQEMGVASEAELVAGMTCFYCILGLAAIGTVAAILYC